MLAKIIEAPPPAIIEAICQSTINLTREEATYTIEFRTRGGPPRNITAPSAVGARELYTQTASRGYAFPFRMRESKDQIVQDIWIVDVNWEACNQETGQTWTFVTRGAEAFYKGQDALAVANRRAFGKAERNACLRCVPQPIIKRFLVLLSEQTGTQVIDDTRSDTPPLDQGHAGGLNHQEVVKMAMSLGYQAREVQEILGTTLLNYTRDHTMEEAAERIQQYHMDQQQEQR